MKNYNLNIIVGTIGILLMLTGLVFVRTEVVVIPLTGVGGSILATAIVNWTLNRRLEAIPINSIIEALAQKTQFMRIHHEVELIFTLQNEHVKLTKRHKYNLRNPCRFKRERKILMFTDATGDSLGNSSGFVLVVGPDGKKLEGDMLDERVHHKGGKYVFKEKYKIQPGDENAFEFRSQDFYRLIDRLIWTVQDLSDNLTVRIINRTGLNQPFKVKINHHREEEIANQIKKLEKADELIIKFNTEILPYQGFEIMWNLGQNTFQQKG